MSASVTWSFERLIGGPLITAGNHRCFGSDGKRFTSTEMVCGGVATPACPAGHELFVSVASSAVPQHRLGPTSGRPAQIWRDGTSSGTTSRSLTRRRSLGPRNGPKGCSRCSIILFDLVGRTGFEPVTFSVSGRRAPAAPTARDDESLPDFRVPPNPCQAGVSTGSSSASAARARCSRA